MSFNIMGEAVYFDNAATSGHKPKSVIMAVNNALINLSANPGRSGHLRSLAAQETVYNCRKKCVEMFGAKSEDNVIFTASCTAALNTVIKGVLKSGDHVVVSSLEHNSVMRPLEKLKVEKKIEYDIAEVVFDDSEATFRAFYKKIKDNTRLVICTHASNVTGEIMPIAQIGELCHRHKILFAVDGAQTAGVLPINMETMNIDYLCIAAHKGLYAPMGLGVLIVNAPIDDTLIQGGTGSNSANLIQLPIMPEAFESGTVNLPAIAGLSAGIDFVNRVGIENIRKKENKIASMIFDRLYSFKNIITYTSPHRENYVAVIPFNFYNMQSEEAARYLSNHNIAVRAGLHCAPLAHKRLGTFEHGCVRISLSYFNTEQEVNVLYGALKNF